MTSVSEENEPLSVGSALTDTFSIFNRNILTFLVIGLIADIPSILQWLYYQATDSLLLADVSTVQIAAAIAGFLLFFVVQSMGIVVAVRVLNGQPVSIADSFAQVLPRLGAVVLGSFLVGIACLVGFLLLIVPGIILMVALWVAVPTIVVERQTAVAGFKRSMALTAGNRWRLFAIVVILILIGLIVSAATGLLVFVLGALAPILAIVVNALVLGFTSCLSGVLYVHLRRIRDGIGIDRLAEVFS